MGLRHISAAVIAVLVSLAATPGRAAPSVRGLTGPSNRVTAVAWSPDGKTLAAGGADRAVRLFDPESGALRQFIDTSGAVGALVWARDGSLVIVASDGMPLQAWAPDGSRVWSARVPARVQALVLTGDGKSVIAALADGSLRWFDAHTGRGGRTIKASKAPIAALDVSRDGLFLVASDESNVRIWNGHTFKLLFTIPSDPKEEAVAVAISPDGRVLSIAAKDGEVKFRTLLDAKSVGGFTATGGAAIRTISYSAAGDRLLTSASDGDVQLLDIVNGVRVAEYVGHTEGGVSAAAVSPDGHTVATGGDDATVRLWDADTGRQRMKLMGPRAVVTGVAYVPGSPLVATGSSDGLVHVWDLTTGLVKWQRQAHDGSVSGLAVSGDGRYLVTSGGFEEAQPLVQADMPVSLNPDAKPPPLRGDIKVWRSADGMLIRRLAGHSDPVDALALSGDGRTLATAAKSDLMVWDMARGISRFRLSGHTGRIRALAFAANAGTLVSAGDDGTARLWNAETSALLSTIQVGRPITAVALSPDGSLVVTGAVDDAGAGLVQVWDATSGKLLRTLPGAHGSIASLSFSPSGWYIASTTRAQHVGSADAVPGEARVWLSQTGDPVGAVAATVDSMIGMTSAAFAPDDHALLLGCEDRSVRLWSIK